MTNKEKYKQAFSVLHPSSEISLEVEMMMIKNKKARFRTAMAATAACLLLAGGGSIAYASDVGGIQRTVQIWVHGELTNATFEYSDEEYIEYILTIPDKDNDAREVSTVLSIFDREPLTESEIQGFLNSPEVEYRDDGTVWVYYYDQKIEITDQFENDVCYVKLTHEDETLYMTVKYQDGWRTSSHKYVSPDTF